MKKIDKCDCRVEYDEDREPIKVLCDKHRKEENERFKQMYK